MTKPDPQTEDRDETASDAAESENFSTAAATSEERARDRDARYVPV